MATEPQPTHAIVLWFSCVLATSLVGVLVIGGLVGLRVAGGMTSDQAVAEFESRLRDPVWLGVTTFINEVVLLATVLVAVRVGRFDKRVALPLARPSIRGVVGTLLVVFGSAPLASLVGELVRRAVGGDSAVMEVLAESARSATPATMLLLFATVAVMPGVAEECVFRGFIQRAFGRAGPVVAVGASSVLFGLVHLEPVQVAGTMVLGVAFALGRHYTGSLVPCMVAHAVYNASVIVYVRIASDPLKHDLDPLPVALGLCFGVAGVLVLRGPRSGGGDSAERGPAPGEPV